MNQEVYDLLIKCREVISTCSGNQRDLCDRLDVLLNKVEKNPIKFHWRPGKNKKWDCSTAGGYDLYVWPEEVLSDPWFRYVISRNGELVTMGDARSREEAKETSELWVINRRRKNDGS